MNADARKQVEQLEAALEKKEREVNALSKRIADASVDAQDSPAFREAVALREVVRAQAEALEAKRDAASKAALKLSDEERRQSTKRLAQVEAEITKLDAALTRETFELPERFGPRMSQLDEFAAEARDLATKLARDRDDPDWAWVPLSYAGPGARWIWLLAPTHDVFRAFQFVASHGGKVRG